LHIATAIRAFGFALLGCLLLTILASRASAEPAPLHGADERYFIEFRARPSTFVGHTYVVYGRADAAGRILDQRYAGLIPDNRDWKGLFLPIPASVREDKDDARLKPDNTYRRELSAAEYARLSRAVRFLRNNEREWHLIFQNCNDFAIVLAEALGLRRPPSLMLPSLWVSTLRALNE
jgi:hypothetical protein